jgi:hypothetical protein
MARKTSARTGKPTPSAAGKAVQNASDKAAKEEANRILAEIVYDLRENQGQTWAQISDSVGWGDGNAQGRLQFLYFQEQARRDPSLRITYKSRADLGKKVVALRNRKADPLSWGKIAAFAGVGEGMIKAVYAEASGGSHVGHRIGKGGRRIDGGSAPKSGKPAAKVSKPAAAGKTTGKRRAAKAAPAPEAKPKARAPRRPARRTTA